jgi:NTE family protein
MHAEVSGLGAGQAPCAARLYAALLPLADQVAGGATNAFALTPVGRAHGRLALLLDRPGDARRHFEQAIAVSETCGSEVWLEQASRISPQWRRFRPSDGNDDDVSPRRVALALGTGGARGYAHIGVLDALAEREYEVVALAGSGMGAVVGGLHAAGALPDYAAWARSLTQHRVLSYLDAAVAGPGALRAEKFLAPVFELVGDTVIEGLPMHFTAVAADLLTGQEIWLQEGPLATALEAAVATPGIITPAMLNGRLLVDGGILDPVPVAATAAIRSDLVVAVCLTGDEGAGAAAPARATAGRLPIGVWLERLHAGAGRVMEPDAVEALVERVRRAAVHPETDVHPQLAGLPEQLSPVDVMNLSMAAMQSQLTRHRLAGYLPDVLITVPRDACRPADFHRADDLITLGRHLAVGALDAYETSRR